MYLYFCSSIYPHSYCLYLNIEITVKTGALPFTVHICLSNQKEQSIVHPPYPLHSNRLDSHLRNREMAVSQVRHQDSIYSYHIYPSDSSNMKNQSLLMHPYDFLPTITSGSLWNVSRVVTHNLLVYLVFLVLWYGFCPVASHSISTAQTKTSCETHSILLLCGLSQSASVKGADFFFNRFGSLSCRFVQG